MTARRFPPPWSVALWVCGLLASAIIGGFIGSLLERPYSSGAGLLWGGMVGVGLFAFVHIEQTTIALTMFHLGLSKARRTM